MLLAGPSRSQLASLAVKALVFEPDPGGHRLQYAGLVARGLHEVGVSVVLATSHSAVESSAWSRYMSDTERLVDVASQAVRINSGSIRSGRSRLAELRAAIRTHQPNRVYLPFADGMTQIAAIGRWINRWRPPEASPPVEALLLRVWYAYPGGDVGARARESLARFGSSHPPWSVLHFNDPAAYRVARDVVPERSLGELVPEPVEQRQRIRTLDARMRLGIEPTGKLLVLAGAVNEHKGADLLLQAFRDAGTGEDVRLLLAGTFSPSVTCLIRSQYADLVETGRLIVRPGFMEADEFWNVLCAADAICLPYRKHIGSSGLAAYAAYLKKPVLASKFGWVGEAVRRFQLGLSIDVENRSQLQDAVCRVTSESQLTGGSASAEFVRFNTEANFMRAWTRGVVRGTTGDVRRA